MELLVELLWLLASLVVLELVQWRLEAVDWLQLLLALDPVVCLATKYVAASYSGIPRRLPIRCVEASRLQAEEIKERLRSGFARHSA